LQLVRRFRIQALFCALAVLLCELASHPFAEMGISDEWSYIRSAQRLAATGHIIYSGWSSPMMLAQLYLGAAFIKIFGFSFTTVRMSTVFIAAVMAFLLQRTLVAANVTGRNATIATLTFVLSPLYLLLSATYMTDITGLFAILICLYGCLRALQSPTSRTAIAWLCFAVATNALCGTSRQIAWLGILVMVPCTLYLLRAKRQVLLTGLAANLAGFLFILGCMHWFARQPYTMPQHLLVGTFPAGSIFWQLINFFLDFPLLLLPIFIFFIPQIRKSSPRSLAILFLVYLYIAVHPRHSHIFLLEPTNGDWVSALGIYGYPNLNGNPPIFLHTGVQILLTILSFGGLIGLIALMLRPRQTPSTLNSPTLTWHQLGVLLAPFSIAYTALLIPRAGISPIFDRYALALLVIALLCVVRYYQDRVQPQLPLLSLLFVAIVAAYSIVLVHNTFSFYRARVTLAAELHAANIPDTSIDNGWEYNSWVELQHADHINESTVEVPAHAYTPTPPLPANTCPMFWYDKTPHIHPLYGVSFDPAACYGPAPFAPVHYSRWPYPTPGTLYAVNYLAPTKP
jgi:hypothetical protein